MDLFSFIANAHPEYIESLYQDYKTNPDSIDAEWKSFFEGFDFASTHFESGAIATKDAQTSISKDEFKVYALIESYRKKGHLLADTNPIRPRKDRKPHLELSDFGLSNSDLEKKYSVGSIINLPNATLKQIIDQLKLVYTGKIGYEYTFIENQEELNWLQAKIEDKNKFSNFDLNLKKRILSKLNETVVFENFLNKKYVGQKRFSLEGGESTIPAIDAIINQAAELGAEEFTIGMAHRGRLNVLANVMGKTYEHIFNEFEGQADPDLTMGDGDVKYHLGYSSQMKATNGQDVYLKLLPNPSHLECVSPVVQGYTRAKIDLNYKEAKKILPILLHGDAAFAGQGVVYETVQMGQLKGYEVGGSIHFVINNQIGFTTDFDDARSSNYSTASAKLVQAPVFHVNGDDVESVVFVARLAAEYRQKFGKDAFIDMVCYRVHGHNEGDDPKYTQPTMYAAIKNHPDPRELYINKLVNSGDIGKQLADEMNNEFWNRLQERLDMVKEKPLPYLYQDAEIQWKKLKSNLGVEKAFPSPKTGVAKAKINKVIKALGTTPDGFNVLRKMKKQIDSSQNKMINDGIIDWAAAELLAYGTLLLEGHDVRMTGQDVKRGTFSHRHAVLFDEKTAEQYNRLNHIEDDQNASFRIFNSHLSEFAVMGFEYGYSLFTPNSLNIWEAQFGDFANGAQVLVDQFLSAGESKWQRMSDLILMLPHGYEGQGPEHSSARLERFLQNSAEYNWSVVNITDPANYFHALRRQLKRDFRKPLISMSPKSGLRHPRVVSPISEITKGTFKEIIDDNITDKQASKVKRVLFCSGKIYFDLIEYKEENKRDDVAIVRLEQLYPLDYDTMEALFKKYNKASVYWVQEEPENMGSWYYILSCLRDVKWNLVSRKPSASPATGFKKVHLAEQAAILDKAFNK